MRKVLLIIIALTVGFSCDNPQKTKEHETLLKINYQDDYVELNYANNKRN